MADQKHSPRRQRGVPKRVFADADHEARIARDAAVTPQTADPAYRLAYQDEDLLLRDDLRPVRFQLELLKTQLILDEADIGSTFVFYGSARIPSPERAPLVLAAAKTPEQAKIAANLAANARACMVKCILRSAK